MVSQTRIVSAENQGLGAVKSSVDRRNGLPFTELQSYASALRAAFPTAVLYYNEAWPALVPTMPGAGQYVGTMGAIPDAQLLRSVPTELDWFSV